MTPKEFQEATQGGATGFFVHGGFLVTVHAADYAGFFTTPYKATTIPQHPAILLSHQNMVYAMGTDNQYL